MTFLRSATFFLLSLWACTCAFAAPTARQDDSGTILLPTNGAIINPGQSFDFIYNARGDYGVTSLNYTVLLMTSSPTSFAPSADFATGHFFGRFSEPNYPGNPNPPNPPPAQLVMPDFAKSPGGFGVGKPMANGTFSLVVLEEYVTGTATVGAQMSLTSIEIIYNDTASATST